MFNPLDFSGKKILITGASSGIGKATAIYLSTLGASLVINGRNSERLLQTQALLKSTGHISVASDLTTIKDATYIYEQAVSDGVKLDGLVHSAGIIPTIPLQQLTREKARYIMDLNFYSFIEMVRQYVRRKYSNGGSIVAVSSIASVQPEACQTIYSASKSAMNASVQALSLELIKRHVRINSLLPGVVWTDNNPLEENEIAELGRKQLLGLIDVNGVAGAIAFLLSDMAKFITGRNLYFDAGRFS